MSEHVYDNPIYPGLAMEVRHGRGEREVEMEERGEREVDIYVSADDLDPGTQQHAVQKNAAQEQCGDADETKKKLFRAALFLVLLCVLLLAVIIGLVIYYFELIKAKNNNLAQERDEIQFSFDHLETRYKNLTEEQDQLETKYNNVTEEKDQLETRYNNVTEEKGQLETSYNNVTEEKDQLETRYNNVTAEKDQLETKYNNVTAEKDQLQSGFDQLQTRYNQLMEQDDTKRIICENKSAHRFTYFGGLCYFISTGKITWENSRQWCRDEQSNLMVINSKEKQDFLVSLRQKVWIGLSDREVEGNWKWVDGTHELTTSEYWSSNQPNNSGGRDCVEFLFSWSTRARAWNVRSCDDKNKWICERVIN